MIWGFFAGDDYERLALVLHIPTADGTSNGSSGTAASITTAVIFAKP